MTARSRVPGTKIRTDAPGAVRSGMAHGEHRLHRRDAHGRVLRLQTAPRANTVPPVPTHAANTSAVPSGSRRNSGPAGRSRAAALAGFSYGPAVGLAGTSRVNFSARFAATAIPSAAGVSTISAP